MEIEHTVTEAKITIHKLLQRNGKRHSRIHMNAAEDNVNRLRALEGICGHCVNLIPELHHQDGKSVVDLRCRKGFSPLTLYQHTEFGQDASCKSFEEKVKQPQSINKWL